MIASTNARMTSGSLPAVRNSPAGTSVGASLDSRDRHSADSGAANRQRRDADQPRAAPRDSDQWEAAVGPGVVAIPGRNEVVAGEMRMSGRGFERSPVGGVPCQFRWMVKPLDGYRSGRLTDRHTATVGNYGASSGRPIIALRIVAGPKNRTRPTLIGQILLWRFRQPEARDDADEVHREADCGRDIRHFGGRVRAIGGHGQRGREPRERRADQASADVCREALTRAAQVQRIHARQIVPPETELADGKEPREEHPDVEPVQARRRRRSQTSTASR